MHSNTYAYSWLLVKYKKRIMYLIYPWKYFFPTKIIYKKNVLESIYLCWDVSYNPLYQCYPGTSLDPLYFPGTL